jgi:hypothetical protein
MCSVAGAPLKLAVNIVTEPYDSEGGSAPYEPDGHAGRLGLRLWNPLLAFASVPSLAAAPERAGEAEPAQHTPHPTRTGPFTLDVLLGLVVAAGLLSLAFVTSGSVGQVITASNTWAEITLTVIGAAGCAASILLGARGDAWGAVTVGLFAALVALTALSVIWSVQPDFSWFAADQMLSYLAIFAGAAAMARLAPGRWRALAGGVAVAMVGLSLFALLAKVFPETLARDNALGRLQQPFGYWNAVGVAAALGVPACLWSGARREGGRILRALSASGLSLVLAAVVLSYSRSALLVAVIGGGLWMAFVPLRLRATVTLLVGACGAAAISAYALTSSGLTTDGVSMDTQTSAGHSFGVVLLVVLVVVTAAGFAATAAIDRVTLTAGLRRRAGTTLIVLVALLPVAGVIGLAESSRGLTGEISHAWSSLVDVNASVGDTAGRVLEFGSSRPRYWHQGIKVGEHALLKGVGALGYGTAVLRFPNGAAQAGHAHSYLVETFADLGLIGLALTLALLLAWCVSAARAVGPRTSWASLSPDAAAERQGIVTLLVIVVVFGIQSTTDWTWYFPGVAIPALVCAGWLAGRGPLARRPGGMRQQASIIRRPAAGTAVTALAAVVLMAAWVMWQPLRSADDVIAASTASSNPQAFADARSAASSDPLAYEPLFELSALYQRIGDQVAARAELIRATRVQPENSATWLQLGSSALRTGDPATALRAMTRAYTLNPGAGEAIAGIAQARVALERKSGLPRAP